MKTCQPSFHKGQVNLLITEHYRSPIDFAFFADGNHFVRFCKYGNGQAGAIEVYSLWDGDRRTLHLYDPPVSIVIAEDLKVVSVLDAKSRVFISVLPSLDAKVELLPPTRTQRQIFVLADLAMWLKQYCNVF